MPDGTTGEVYLDEHFKFFARRIFEIMVNNVKKKQSVHFFDVSAFKAPRTGAGNGPFFLDGKRGRLGRK